MADVKDKDFFMKSAQTAFSDAIADSFWREVSEHLDLFSQESEKLVEPRKQRLQQ